MKDIESQVCEDIIQRQRLGFAKYGTSVANNPLPLKEWLNHAYQECLDQAVYLKRAISEIESKENQFKDGIKIGLKKIEVGKTYNLRMSYAKDYYYKVEVSAVDSTYVSGQFTLFEIKTRKRVNNASSHGAFDRKCILSVNKSDLPTPKDSDVKL